MMNFIDLFLGFGAGLLLAILLGLIFFRIVQNKVIGSRWNIDAILSVLPSIILIVNHKFKIVKLVNSLQRYLGTTDVEGLDVETILDKKYKDVFAEKISETLRTGESSIFTFNLGDDNEIEWFKAYFSKLGRKHVVIVFRNATEFQEAKKMRSTLENIFNHIPIGLSIKDVDNELRYIMWNETLEKITGLKKSQVIGKKDSEIFDEETADNYNRTDLEVVEKDESIATLQEIQNLNGKKESVLIDKTTFIDEGKKYVIFSVKTVTDIIKTEQDLAVVNKQLRMALIGSKISPIVWNVTEDKISLYVTGISSESAQEETRFKEVGKEFMIRMIIPEQRENYRALLDKLLDGTQEEVLAELESFRKDIREYYSVHLAVHEKDADGKALKIVGTIQNISEQKRRENILEKSHRFFEEVLDSMPFPVAAKKINNGFKYAYWNKKSEELFHVKKEDIIGKDDFEIFGPEFGTIAREKDLKMVGKKDQVVRCFAKYHPQQGDEIDAQEYMTCLTSGDNEYVIRCIHDLTDQNRLTQKVADNETLLLEILDSMPVPVSVKDVDDGFKYVIWNKYSEQVLGKLSKDVVGKNDFDIYGKEKGKIYRQADEKTCEIGMYQYQDVYTSGEDGEFVSVIYKKVISFGSRKLIVMARLNITELIHAESKLKEVDRQLRMSLLLGNIAPMTWNVEKDEFKFTIPEFKKQNSGFDVQKDGISLNELIQKVHPDDVENTRAKLRQMASGEAKEAHFEARFDVRGIYNYYETYWNVVETDKNDKVLNVVGIVQNITKRKIAALELQLAKEKAENSDRMKTAFLENMSHEIRTPLNGIIGFSELLMSATDDDEKKEYMEIINFNNNSLLSLVNNILDLSKIESDTFDFSFSNVNITLMMRELEQKYNEDQGRGKSLKVRYDEAEIGDYVIVTEKNRVQQVMTNFILNSLKFSNSGEISFGFKREKDRIRFYVTDQGIGIPKSEQSKVFDRFYKVNNFTSGTGLGLSICQEIVKKLKGTIGFTSEEGKGSTFWFEIPCKFIVNKAKPIVEIEKQNMERDEKKLILVAEDMQDNYHLVKILLEKQYDLLHAWNGFEAVNLFEDKKPDAILMDIKMPGMDGYQATAIIRGKNPDIPIIAVTAYAYAEDKEKILKSGFNTYISKPISLNAIKDALNKYGL